MTLSFLQDLRQTARDESGGDADATIILTIPYARVLELIETAEHALAAEQPTAPSRPADYPATPELDRLLAVKDISQAQGEFIAWLNKEDFQICASDGSDWHCSAETIEQLLARFHRIDLDKVEADRSAIRAYHSRHNA